MSERKREALLWQKIKRNIKNIFFTRIESSTMNGIPDIHCVVNQRIFWIELKSDYVSYPKLNKWQVVWINKYIKHGGIVIICKEALKEPALKLYRPVSSFTDPRELKPRFEFSFPVQWPLVQAAFTELGAPVTSAALELRSRSRLKPRSRSPKRVRIASAATNRLRAVTFG